MNLGPKDKQKRERPTTENKEDRFAPERHDTNESLEEQPLVNEEKQNKIVNEQNDLGEKEANQESKRNVQDKGGGTNETIPAMD